MRIPLVLGPPPGLLVSVRSAVEAIEAARGGASLIDVKEPARGPLGPADPSVWVEVRAALPSALPISVALGEAIEWLRQEPTPIPLPEQSHWRGIAFRKLGLAGLGDRPDWWSDYRSARLRLGHGPPWVAVVYADHKAAKAPHPASVVQTLLHDEQTAGLLVDTWDKTGPRLDAWIQAIAPLVEAARQANWFVALAGRIQPEIVGLLSSLHPDLFAVRGAACLGGREGRIDRGRVEQLVQSLPGQPRSHAPVEAIKPAEVASRLPTSEG